MTSRTEYIIAGTLLVTVGAASLVGALLLALGKVKPGKWWGRSAASALLDGIGCVTYGAATLVSRVMMAKYSPLSTVVFLTGVLVFVIAILAARFLSREPGK